MMYSLCRHGAGGALITLEDYAGVGQQVRKSSIVACIVSGLSTGENSFHMHNANGTIQSAPS